MPFTVEEILKDSPIDVQEAQFNANKARLIATLCESKAIHDIVMQTAESLKKAEQTSLQDILQAQDAMQTKIQIVDPTPANQEAILATLQPKLDAAIKSSLANDKTLDLLKGSLPSRDKMKASIAILHTAEYDVYTAEIFATQAATQVGIDSITQAIRDLANPELEAKQAAIQAEKDTQLARLGALNSKKDTLQAELEALKSKLDAQLNAQNTTLKDTIKTFCRTNSIMFLTMAVVSLFLPASIPLFVGSVSLAIGFALFPFAYHAICESSWFNEKRKSSNEGTSEKKETVANVSSALTKLHAPTVTEEVSSLEPVGSHSKIFATPLSQPESTTQLTPRP